jgi:hypothetical protein
VRFEQRADVGRQLVAGSVGNDSQAVAWKPGLTRSLGDGQRFHVDDCGACLGSKGELLCGGSHN